MPSTASRRSPLRAEDMERKAKTARRLSPIVVEDTPSSRFSSFEELVLFHNKVWDDVLATGEYKLYVLVLFLWAARMAGSNFEESEVHIIILAMFFVLLPWSLQPA